MEKYTEIIFNDEAIERLDDTLPLNVGDEFYFSIRGTTPRAEKQYFEENKEWIGKLPETLLQQSIDEINKTADKYHIIEFVVTKVQKSYQRDFSFSLSKPKLTYSVSIFVEEKK